MPDSSRHHDQQGGLPPAVDARGDKVELRARLLAARRSRTRSTVDRTAAAVQAALLAILPLPGRPAGRVDPDRAACAEVVVAAYDPLPTEPGGRDLPAVLAAALGSAGRLLLPVLCDDFDLDWVAYPDPAASGPWLGRTAIARAALVVVPALAVDRRGVRLGRGGGSYDRALARVPAGVPVVALVHDDELLSEDLPAERHDQRVSAVITPTAGLVQLPVTG